jgi:hypothetical protein
MSSLITFQHSPFHKSSRPVKSNTDDKKRHALYGLALADNDLHMRSTKQEDRISNTNVWDTSQLHTKRQKKIDSTDTYLAVYPYIHYACAHQNHHEVRLLDIYYNYDEIKPTKCIFKLR